MPGSSGRGVVRYVCPVSREADKIRVHPSTQRRGIGIAIPTAVGGRGRYGPHGTCAGGWSVDGWSVQPGLARGLADLLSMCLVWLLSASLVRSALLLLLSIGAVASSVGAGYTHLQGTRHGSTSPGGAVAFLREPMAVDPARGTVQGTKKYPVNQCLPGVSVFQSKLPQPLAHLFFGAVRHRRLHQHFSVPCVPGLHFAAHDRHGVGVSDFQ